MAVVECVDISLCPDRCCDNCPVCTIHWIDRRPATTSVVHQPLVRSRSGTDGTIFDVNHWTNLARRSAVRRSNNRNPQYLVKTGTKQFRSRIAVMTSRRLSGRVCACEESRLAALDGTPCRSSKYCDTWWDLSRGFKSSIRALPRRPSLTTCVAGHLFRQQRRNQAFEDRQQQMDLSEQP